MEQIQLRLRQLESNTDVVALRRQIAELQADAKLKQEHLLQEISSMVRLRTHAG